MLSQGEKNELKQFWIVTTSFKVDISLNSVNFILNTQVWVHFNNLQDTSLLLVQILAASVSVPFYLMIFRNNT